MWAVNCYQHAANCQQWIVGCKLWAANDGMSTVTCDWITMGWFARKCFNLDSILDLDEVQLGSGLFLMWKWDGWYTLSISPLSFSFLQTANRGMCAFVVVVSLMSELLWHMDSTTGPRLTYTRTPGMQPFWIMSTMSTPTPLCKFCAGCKLWFVSCELWMRNQELDLWSANCKLWTLNGKLRRFSCNFCAANCESGAVNCELRADSYTFWLIMCELWIGNNTLWIVNCELWHVNCVNWELWLDSHGLVRSEVYQFGLKRDSNSPPYGI